MSTRGGSGFFLSRLFNMNLESERTSEEWRTVVVLVFSNEGAVVTTEG